LAGTNISVRSLFRAKRARGSGLRVLLFTLECALGIVVVILVAALAHWSGWLSPVALLLYLLIVVPTALLCGFSQAAIVSLSAVVDGEPAISARDRACPGGRVLGRPDA
jgi:uncharacterized membrane protein YgaE (UPF0421/DUF939 family)